MKRNLETFCVDGKRVVIVNEIRFKGRQHIDWEDVEEYLKQYVGNYYEILETADKVYIGSDFPKEFKGSVDTYKEKHSADAKFGWYRYTSRFALPIYDNSGEIIRLNIFRIEMLIRHASDGKMYLYDLVNIKKEKETKYPT